jgi:hypothetical protein
MIQMLSGRREPNKTSKGGNRHNPANKTQYPVCIKRKQGERDISRTMDVYRGIILRTEQEVDVLVIAAGMLEVCYSVVSASSTLPFTVGSLQQHLVTFMNKHGWWRSCSGNPTQVAPKAGPLPALNLLNDRGRHVQEWFDR